MFHDIGNTVIYNELYIACVDFREKIDNCVRQHSDLFENFPHGYCDHICIWAYDYLVSKGYTGIEFRISDPFLEDRDGSHVWLYWNGYNMDFSCDQFNTTNIKYEKVIIEKIEHDENGNLIRTRYTPRSVTKPTRNNQALLEYTGLRTLFFPNSEKERDEIYKVLGITFELISKTA